MENLDKAREALGVYEAKGPGQDPLRRSNALNEAMVYAVLAIAEALQAKTSPDDA